MANEALERIWKEAIAAFPNIHLQGLQKPTNKFIQ
jgi:hypothetical protein